MSRYKIWVNNLLSNAARDLLVKELGAERLILEEVAKSWLAAGKPDPRMKDAEVVFGQPDPQNVIDSPKVRWVHITSAGYTRYDTVEFRTALTQRNACFTNSSNVYSEPCAQHVVAFILADSRQLFPALDAQRNAKNWPQLEIRAKSRLLDELNILILGYGHIGRRVKELLLPFKPNIIGYRRNPQPENGIQIIGEKELDAALSQADHVINILPENSSTRNFFDETRFNQLKNGTRYHSIGRGTTTNQEALAAALKSGKLFAAYLDVTDPEPLPSDHPLWVTPHCYITPHCSGGHDNEDIRLVEHFLKNLRKFDQGEPLLNRIF